MGSCRTPAPAERGEGGGSRVLSGNPGQEGTPCAQWPIVKVNGKRDFSAYSPGRALVSVLMVSI